MSLKIQHIIPEIQAVFHGNPDSEIDNVSIDSRSLQNNFGTLFFALSGANNDAHQYIEDLISKGVLNFVVNHIPNDLESGANFLVVENTLKALQDFASFYRKSFHFPIIGITGSNGKTIVKEWLNFLLSPDYNIIRSPKSYNSQIGVPLSVISINEKHNLGIFEAGISTTNEMENLEKIIQPTIGILTNIGSAHDEGFSNLEEKITEKLYLFENSEILIYQKNNLVDSLVNPKIKTFCWSFSDEKANVFITQKSISEKTQLHIKFEAISFDVIIPFQDKASVENAINCLMTLLHLGYLPEVIRERIQLLYSVEMRLKVKNGNNNTAIIDDSYSSDYQSLKIALDFLEQQKQYKKKTIILSDIIQSGLPTDELYTKVSELVTSNKIDRIIGIGEEISTYSESFKNIITYKNTSDFISDFKNLTFENETILIKGARIFHFEAITSLLEEKTHETVLEINLNAISHNLNFFKSKLKPETKLMVMVKAFGYGSGGFEIAKLLEYHKVDYLGVAFADEGISLKNAGITLPIMVLNPENTSFPAIIEHNLEPEIYSIKGLRAFLKIAEQKNLQHFPDHLKLETGMHRLGFMPDEVDKLIKELNADAILQVKSAFSHLASAGNKEDNMFTQQQIDLLDQCTKRLEEGLGYSFLRHIAATSGIELWPQAYFDMVRLGIGLYGIDVERHDLPLREVSSLKTNVTQIKYLAAGETVGYNRHGVLLRDSKIATIKIGYADGYDRRVGNGVGKMMVNGCLVPTIGDICMDMCMLDVTEIEVAEEDDVIVYPDIKLAAQSIGTIPYELLTSISQRVKRVYFYE